MNQEISDSSNQPMPDQQISQPPNEGSRTFSPLNAILFEFLFVGIVLVLFFGTLNYFNILRLSEIFPNQLGFLPHKTI